MKSQHRHRVDYRVARRDRYPEVGDQLDAVWALAAWLRDGGAKLPAKVIDWIDACDAVKTAWPKGTPPPAPGEPTPPADPYDK